MARKHQPIPATFASFVVGDIVNSKYDRGRIGVVKAAQGATLLVQWQHGDGPTFEQASSLQHTGDFVGIR
jgi:uncharacterized protein YijF (DUF1287 family)